MARASWGNVGADYSSFFADLYRYEQNKRKSDQRAADNAAAAAWAAGEMDSEAWLAYIAQRLAATANDAEENAYWRQRQIEDTRYVEDTRAQEAYNEAGATGLSAFLAYHQGVLEELNPGSKAYVDRQKMVFDIEDQIDQNDFTRLHNEIVARMESDPTAYKDLVALWTRAKSTVRAGSSFMPTIETQLADAKAKYQTYRAQKAEGDATAAWNAGKLTGRQYAAKLRAVAETYYKGDPTRYYALINDATKFGAYGSGRATGGGGGGGGGGGTGGAVRDIIALHKANRDRFLGIQEEIARAAGKLDATITIDGQTLPIFRPDGSYQPWVDEFHAQALANYDALSNAQQKSPLRSDRDDAGATEKAKSEFIVKNVQPDNTVVGDLMLGRLFGSFQKTLKATMDAYPDPNVALNVTRSFLNDLRALKARYTNTSGSPDERSRIGAGSQASAQFMSNLNVGIAAFESAMSGDPTFDPESIGALMGTSTESLFTTPGMSRSVMTDATKAALTTVNRTAQSANCIANKTCRLVQLPEGVTTVPLVQGTVFDAASGGWTTGAVEDPTVLSDYARKYGGSGWYTSYIKNHGAITPLKTLARPHQLGMAYVATKNVGAYKKGQYIPSAVVNTADFKGWLASGAVEYQPAYSSEYDEIIVPGYSDGNKSYEGRSFIVNRSTGTVFDMEAKALIAPVAYGPSGEPMVEIDATGRAVATLAAGAGRVALPGAFVVDSPSEVAKFVVANPDAFADVQTVNESGGFELPKDGWATALEPMTKTLIFGRDAYWMDGEGWRAKKEQGKKDLLTLAKEQSNRFNDDTGFAGVTRLASQMFNNLTGQMGINLGSAPDRADSATGTFISSPRRPIGPSFPVTNTRDDATGTFVNTPRIAAPVPAAAPASVASAVIPGRTTPEPDSAVERLGPPTPPKKPIRMGGNRAMRN